MYMHMYPTSDMAASYGFTLYIEHYGPTPGRCETKWHLKTTVHMRTPDLSVRQLSSARAKQYILAE
jgi:hypothetical protein